MKELGWSEGDLRERAKSDAAKVALARRLRRATSVQLKWIARQLDMGNWSNVSNLLREKSANSED